MRANPNYPIVSLDYDAMIRAIARRRRVRQVKAALPLVIGIVVLALLCGFLLSDTGHNWMVWMDGGMQ